MAQLNITPNQDKTLQLLSADREDAFRPLLQESLNLVLKAESKKHLRCRRMSAQNAEQTRETASEPEISIRGLER
jgi:hypothetical protein